MNHIRSPMDMDRYAPRVGALAVRDYESRHDLLLESEDGIVNRFESPSKADMTGTISLYSPNKLSKKDRASVICDVTTISLRPGTFCPQGTFSHYVPVET